MTPMQAQKLEAKTDYRLVLGLELHMHLKVATKMFCGCSSDIYDALPNTHTCPTCLGLPGALPVPNFEAVQKTQLLGLALHCDLNTMSRFDRKHYFYPDLPKGYQLSQYKHPLCTNGYLDLADGTKIYLERIHLEEDTGKSMHVGQNTLLDFNKSGMALLEVVTKPCITSASQAVEFAKKLKDLARYLNVSDADMEKGQMRIEPNISVRTRQMEQEGKLPTYKVEVKNINSFKFMEKAVNYEFARQAQALENQEVLVQENRGWDEKKNKTVLQRTKEEAKDYRYFPEPDIPPMAFDTEYFAKLKASLPELPWELKKQLVTENQLTPNQAEFFTEGQGLDFINLLFAAIKLDKAHAKDFANLLQNKKAAQSLTSEDLVAYIQHQTPVVAEPDAIKTMCEAVLAENPSVVKSFKSGKVAVLQFLIGQVMRKANAKLEPTLVERTLLNLLN